MKTIRATRLLRNDHKELTGLFRQYEAVDQRADEMKLGIAREIFAKLEIHTLLEEELFYPMILETWEDQQRARALVEEAEEDHRECRDLVADLRDSLSDQVQFDAKMVDLIEAIEAHANREENVIFPIAEHVLGATLDAIGQEMFARKEQLMALPEFIDAHPQFAQNPHGGEQKRAA